MAKLPVRSEKGGAMQLIVTLGPSTSSAEMLRKIAARDVDYVRINLSHTKIEDLETTIRAIRNEISTPIIVDTEGCQIRTGDLGVAKVALRTGDSLRLYRKAVKCSSSQLFLRPAEAVASLRVGDLIFVDFDTAILRVDSLTDLSGAGYVECTVITGGDVGNNKAVSVENQQFQLPALSEKDRAAIEISRRHGITLLNLSFVNSREDVQEVRELYPEATVISKIETKRAVENLDSILDCSDGILIDRGDLSREVPLERVAFAQKIIIHRANGKRIPVFVATNFLDTMMASLKPSRAEINDIVNTLVDGADGLVLAAETAVGKHPIEAINLIQTVGKQTLFFLGSTDEMRGGTQELIQVLERSKFLTSPTVGASLIRPHGGQLVDRLLQRPPPQDYLASLPALELRIEQAMDAEQLAIGTYSPLQGFMGPEELASVLANKRLPGGKIWPMPILLQVEEARARSFGSAPVIKLVSEGDQVPFGLLHVSEVFPLKVEDLCRDWFGTVDSKHPGVARILGGGSFSVAGRVSLFSRPPAKQKNFELTPLQVRKIFESRGWTRVVGFHSRNVPHRSHEYLHHEAMIRGECDGLFIHPVVGQRKAGDFEAEAIIRAYSILLRAHYPENKVLFSTFASYSRFAGPREAVFTALCRQNFGCSHFIVGRDHAGVGSFYAKDAARRIFEEFPDLDIKPIFFDEVGYLAAKGAYGERTSAEESFMALSGTELRSSLLKGERPPEWLVRPEISNYLLSEIAIGRKVFTE